MNKLQLIICAILILALMPYAYALKTGVVVDVNGDVYKGCVLTEAGNSAYDVLNKFDDANRDIDIKFDGVITGTPFLKSVNDIEGECLGNPLNCLIWSGWNFWISDKDNDFKEPPELAPGWGMGIGDYKIANEIDAIGVNFAVTEYNADWTVKVKPNKPDYAKYSQLCESLNIKDIKAYVDGKKESGADEDGGKINVIPGSELELKIIVENLYDDEDNINIEDITIEGVLESIDDGNDIDDEANDFNLNPEKDKEVSLKFNIPLEVEEGNYDLIIIIDGENENGFSYSEEIEFEVVVDKENHDILFNKLQFSNDDIECGSSASLDVKVINMGVNEESVKLTISNDELGINIQESFKLNEDPFTKDNSFIKYYNIKLPDKINPGEYTLFADLFYGDKIESSVVKLNVKCTNPNEQTSNEANSKEIKSAVNNPAKPKTSNLQGIVETTPTKISGAVITKAEEKKILNANLLMPGIFIGEVILLIAGIVLLVYISRK